MYVKITKLPKKIGGRWGRERKDWEHTSVGSGTICFRNAFKSSVVNNAHIARGLLLSIL